MGILADIGRSNISGELGKLGTFIREQKDQALREREAQMGEMRFEREGETHKLNLRKTENELAEQERAIAFQKKPVILRMTAEYRGLSPEGQKWLEGSFKSMGIVDDKMDSTIGDLQLARESLWGNIDKIKEIGGLERNSRMRAFEEAELDYTEELQKATESGKTERDIAKDKKLNALKIKRDSAFKSFNMFSEGYLDRLNELEKVKERGKAEGEGKATANIQEYNDLRSRGHSRKEALAIAYGYDPEGKLMSDVINAMGSMGAKYMDEADIFRIAGGMIKMKKMQLETGELPDIEEDEVIDDPLGWRK